MNKSKIALITLDYAPQQGGIAHYLGSLVQVSSGVIDVIVDKTHLAVESGQIKSEKLFGLGWPKWWPSVGCIRGLRGRGYDWVLVSHILPLGTAAWLASFFGGPKYAVLIHGLDLRMAKASRWKRWLARRVLKRASLVIANSKFTAKEIQSFASKIDPLVLTPGVEQMVLPERNVARQKLGVQNSEKIILAVARLVPRKGIDKLLESLPLLPEEVRLVVIGDGQDRARLEELAKPLGERVKFVCNAGDNVRDSWYAAADVFALPVRDEVSDVEGFGIVYLEAAAAGLPVLAGRSGGAAEAVIDSETGLVVDPTDVQSIASGLRRLIDDPALRLRFGQAGKNRVKKDFQWDCRWQTLSSAISGQVTGPLISVVIPVWNHAPELMGCLAALAHQTYRNIEVIVVDDGSTDDVVQRVASYQAPFPFQFIHFDQNRGAPAARNEGFRRSKGEYVIFLDADAMMEPRALEKMVRILKDHPEAAYAYASFRFGWKLFKGRPFDLDFLKTRNYIHTSALIRREAFPGFDESLKKFQDWDLWLTMAERGHRGFWLDQKLFDIKPHRQGMSQWLPKFIYWIPWDVLGWGPARIRKYRQAEEIVLRKHNLLTEESLARRVAFKRRVLFWFLGLAVMELVSRLVIFHPLVNGIVALALGLGILILTVIRPSASLAVLAAELLIGSKGALFKIGGDEHNDGGYSIRIIFFAAFLLGWTINAVRAKAWYGWREMIKGRTVYLILAVALVYAFVLGWLRGNRAFLIEDANAWATWLLLFPVLDVVRRHKNLVRHDMRPALIASLFWLPIKTLLLFYFFSHGFLSYANSIYLWVRRTGVGEITLLALNAYRIFFQSHVYAALVIVSLSVWLAYRERFAKWASFLLVFTWAEILISLSRSFWLGVVAGLLGAVVIFIRRNKRWPRFAIKRLAVTFGLALLLVGGTLALPLPPVDTSSLFSLLGSRADLSESAAVSRWTLLRALESKIAEHPLLGSGFGASVTYESKDPRIVEQYGGLYTTYAFEWGWLEHWVKFGLIGIPLMLWLLWSLGRRLWRSTYPEWLRVAVVCSLLTLAVIHTFSPYLNHPLGFLAIFFGEALLEYKKEPV